MDGFMGFFFRATRPNYFAEMCSGSEAGSCLRLIDFVYHSTLGLRVINNNKKTQFEQTQDAVEKRAPKYKRAPSSFGVGAIPYI